MSKNDGGKFFRAYTKLGQCLIEASQVYQLEVSDNIILKKKYPIQQVHYVPLW